MNKAQLVSYMVEKLFRHHDDGTFVPFNVAEMDNVSAIRDVVFDDEIQSYEDIHLDDLNLVQSAIIETFDVSMIADDRSVLRAVFSPLKKQLNRCSYVVSAVLLDIITEAMLEAKGYYKPTMTVV